MLIPQGKSDTYIDSIVDDYYRSGRYGWGIMQFPVSTFKVLGYSPYSDSDDFTLLKNKVGEVYEKKGWTIIYFHQVLPEKRGSDVSTADFEKFLDYIMQKGVAVITVNQGLDIGSIRKGVNRRIFQRCSPTTVLLEECRRHTVSPHQRKNLLDP